MVENGSSGGGPSLPPGESHDEFLELCALATTEWLSLQERRRLNEHLAGCSPCREALRQYEALVADGVPASGAGAAGIAADSEHGWSLDQAEAALFARLDREAAVAADPGSREVPHVSSRPVLPAQPSFPADALWRHMWWQYAAGLLLAVAIGYSVYRTGIHRGTEMARIAVPSAVGHADSAADSHAEAAAAAESQAAALRRRDAELAALRTEIARQSAQIAQLGAEKAKLEQNLTGEEGTRGSVEQARDDLARQRDAAQAQLEDVRMRLDAAAAKNAADEVRVAALEHQIADLNTGAEQKDQELAREQELLDHDQDIRELVGSRNLYIAEVYDVDKAGNTRQPFGRVFYTKGKSLIFYAYDLDQQPELRTGSTFQAWGRRGPDQDRAVNLGTFYVDNAAKKRWVLRADNPKALADIDAVFVTVEPPGGASHPSGKPLLFAYLRIEPNHP